MATSAQRANLEQAYAAWRSQAPTDPDGGLTMVLVASEGGASRAGFWTGEVLSALHRDDAAAFDRRLFAISSVSGGSVGAVGYVAAQAESPAASPIDLEQRIQRFTGADALSPAAGGLLFPDLLQRFVPIAGLPDRAEALERSWEVAWDDGCLDHGPCAKGLIGGPFLNLWIEPPAVWKRPLVIVDGASEESGRPILTSRLRFAPGQMDADDFYRENDPDIPASTAIHNGARFPWVSPAGGLRGAGHIVDGGYYDPAGVETVRELARAIKAGPARTENLRFVIVFIGYNGSTPKPATKRFLNDVRAPLAAIFQSRQAHGDHLINALQQDLAPGVVASRATTVASPNDGASPLNGQYLPILLCDQKGYQPPMDWALSVRAQAYMRGLMGFGDAAPLAACAGNKQVLETIHARLAPVAP